MIYDIITHKIIEKLNNNVIPWKKGWHSNYNSNFITGHSYKGINALVTNLENYSNPYWITFNQAKKNNILIKKGEKATPIVFFNIKEYQDKNSPEKVIKVPIISSYYIFNLEQTDFDVSTLKNQIVINDDTTAEQILTEWKDKPLIQYSGNEAFYSPHTDIINIPNKESFISVNEYYSTLFHEAIHSTGHISRLNRFDKKSSQRYGDEKYSIEELIAEIGSAFLCSLSGVSNEASFDNQVSYIHGWIQKLTSDKTFIIKAANQAQKAVDYILKQKEDQYENN